MLTAERLRELLQYDAETGDWIWRISLARCVMAGTMAGCINHKGYSQITVVAAKNLFGKFARA